MRALEMMSTRNLAVENVQSGTKGSQEDKGQALSSKTEGLI
jgi:hypothetical protein